jgi:hypothetical protein
MASLSLARIALGRGALAEAEALAREACEKPFSYFLMPARSTLSTVLLAQGRVAEARREAALGVREWEAMGGTGVAAVGMHLALAEACLAEGAPLAGEASLRRALQCLRERSLDIPDATVRERFLRQVPENARVLELACQRWGEAEVS